MYIECIRIILIPLKQSILNEEFINLYHFIRKKDVQSELSKEEFEIEGPVTDFKFSFEVGDNETSKSVIFKSFDFKIDPS